ncbi:disease resistance protein RPP13-like [Zingiber officinale]|uniref:disease resistance protein RPP13-like n=1 Tax=Zingiber officinale TaxID=94328 RepID=UPI001C4AA751|nr:disease resistance protein RPP13-like [Zingiber officinale]
MESTIVNLVLGKLGELASSEVAGLFNVGAEVESLTKKLLLIQSYLRDADQKPRSEQSQSLQEWLRQIRNLAFEMEDLVDEYATRLGRASAAGGRESCLRRIAAFPSRILTRHRLASHLQDIRARFQDVCNQASQLGIHGSASLALPSSSSSSSSSSSFSAANARLARRFELEEDIVGFDEDMKDIKRQLIDMSSTDRVVLSVVGTGGLGKTTLANKIYRSADVKNYFQCKAWVSVSQKYAVKELLCSIAKQVFDFKDGQEKAMEELEMKEKLSEHLSNRRYLVVIDDIWEVAAWNAIKAALPKESRGSRVLLTTRKMKVANVADVPPHELKFWNVEESWNLFCRKAFRTACCPPEFERFKEDIFKKTKGLPLAIVVLGGVLRGTSQASDWRKKMEHISREFREGEDQILRILALSYHDLPHHLKPCFLYFAAFPEDYSIWAERIIHLWIAEGFIQTNDKVDQTMEDLAEAYLKDLTDRSMLQIERGRMYYSHQVRIHDLLLDLARHEARELNFFRSIDDIGDDPRSLRRLSVTENVNDHISLNCSTTKLRSLVTCRNEGFKRMLAVAIPGAKFLRVLDLQELPIEHLPKEIGDLILLRYLNLERSKLKELPSSIGNLIHLQTFNIFGTKIQHLPDAFWKIRTLRHVFLTEENKSMPKAAYYCSEDIRTLENISIGPWVCDGALEKLRNLRALYLKSISSSDEDALANAVQNLFRLEKLGLVGESLPMSVLTSSSYHHIQFLYLWGPLVRPARIHIEAENSRIFSNLISLFISETRLEKDEDIAMLASLANLEILRLRFRAFVGRVLVFPKGGFPSLQEMELFDLSTMEQWEVGEGAMPFLRELRLWNCIHMRMLPEGLVRLTELNQIDIRGMKMIERRSTRILEKIITRSSIFLALK